MSIRITRVPDLENFRMGAARMFAPVTAADLEDVERTFGAGFVDRNTAEIIINFNAYVIDDGTTVILVDPCIGDGKDRTLYAQWHQRTSDFLQRLARAGYPPERIDIVISTHLHADHVGWNTSWTGTEWTPTFPNAQYLFIEPELTFWQERHAANPDGNVAYGAFVDSVQPILDAGVARTIAAGSELIPGVTLQHAPGHTPGNTIIEVQTPDGAAYILGDIIHHPLQLLRPELSTNFCIDPNESRATRTALIERFAGSGAVVYPAHFVAPSAGRIIRENGRFGYAFTER